MRPWADHGTNDDDDDEGDGDIPATRQAEEALRQRCMRLSSERRAAASDGASAMRAEHAVAAAGPWQNMQLWGKASTSV